MEQEEALRARIEQRLESEKGDAVEDLFADKENRSSHNTARAKPSTSKEGVLTNSREDASKLAKIQIRKMPEQSSKVELKFSEKVFPHLAMREKFLKKLPDPKPKNANGGKRDEHNYLFYKDKGDEFLRRGDLDGAVEAFSVSLELNGECLRALVNRGLAHFRRFDYGASVEDIDAALALMHSRGEILMFRGRDANDRRGIRNAAESPNEKGADFAESGQV